MTSPRRRQDSPIESVELKVTIWGADDELRRIGRAVPGARFKDGELTVTIRGEGPARVAGDTKVLADRVRKVLGGHRPRSATRKRPQSSKRL